MREEAQDGVQLHDASFFGHAAISRAATRQWAKSVQLQAAMWVCVAHMLLNQCVGCVIIHVLLVVCERRYSVV